MSLFSIVPRVEGDESRSYFKVVVVGDAGAGVSTFVERVFGCTLADDFAPVFLHTTTTTDAGESLVLKLQLHATTDAKLRMLVFPCTDLFLVCVDASGDVAAAIAKFAAELDDHVRQVLVLTKTDLVDGAAVASARDLAKVARSRFGMSRMSFVPHTSRDDGESSATAAKAVQLALTVLFTNNIEGRQFAPPVSKLSKLLNRVRQAVRSADASEKEKGSASASLYEAANFALIDKEISRK
jgi:hypothetical protein